MPYRSVSTTVLILIFFGALVFTITYGPAKRTFVVPDRTVTVRSAIEIDELWHASRVHGRVAVVFARHLNQQFSGLAFPEMDYLDQAMRHGIVRKAYYIVPDRFWPEVVLENRTRREFIVEPIDTETGLMIFHEGGRIHAMPLSKYIPETEAEKALVILEQQVWTQQELSRIDGFIKTGQLTTDLLVIINKTIKPSSFAPSGRQL